MYFNLKIFLQFVLQGIADGLQMTGSDSTAEVMQEGDTQELRTRLITLHHTNSSQGLYFYL